MSTQLTSEFVKKTERVIKEVRRLFNRPRPWVEEEQALTNILIQEFLPNTKEGITNETQLNKL